LGLAFSEKRALQGVVRFLYKRAFRKSRRVFFQNRESLELFRSFGFVSDSQAVLIPGSGTDLKRFAPSARDSVASDQFTFLLASRLLWPKGISEYCEGARLIRDQGRNAKFQLLGGIEPSSNKSAIPGDRIARWEEECGIEYLGWTDDVRPFFANADCIVLPSYYPEGVPRTLIEAAAMGKPIITTDTPGCRDVLDHGQTGFLCEARSVEMLAEAMLQMLDCTATQRMAMGRRGRDKAEREFDERFVIDAYLEALKKIAAPDGIVFRANPTPAGNRDSV
jgi:glycosyltransferase involved in cell wall biosynthesis